LAGFGYSLYNYLQHSCIHRCDLSSSGVLLLHPGVSLEIDFIFRKIVSLYCFFAVFQRFYVATSRQLKRLDSVSLSPVYSHFGESLTGVASIRAFGLANEFIKELENKVDISQTCTFPMMISNRYGHYVARIILV